MYLPPLFKVKALLLRPVADPGGGSGGSGPPFPNPIFFFTTCLSLKFSHLQDGLLLLNWLTCFFDGEPFYFATNLKKVSVVFF